MPEVDAGSKEASYTPRRGLLIVAFTAFALWCAALVVLTITTANPPQLNLAQLAAARHLCLVEVLDTQAGRCRIISCWTPGDVTGDAEIENLQDVAPQAGESYIMPLNRTGPPEGRRFTITSVPEAGIPPAVYPDTEQIRSQLEGWLSGS